MSGFHTAVIVGSLRKGSINLKLAKALTKLGEGKYTSTLSRIDDLPLFSQDLESNVPAPVTRLKAEIEKANAVIIVTPEYNRSIPGPLKNAIDWASRPYGKNSFAHKPTALCGTSAGAIGTACSQQALKSVLVYLDTILMGQPELYLQFKEGMIDDDGVVSDAKTREFLQKYVDTFCIWVKKNQVK